MGVLTTLLTGLGRQPEFAASGRNLPRAAPGKETALARTPKTFNKYLRLSTVGLELGFSVILGLFIGQYLDSLLGTEPWLLLLFLLLGAAAGFRRLYRLLKEVAESGAPPPGDKDDSP